MGVATAAGCWRLLAQRLQAATRQRGRVMPNVYAATALLALGCHTSGGCTSMCMLSKAAGRAGQGRQVGAGRPLLG